MKKILVTAIIAILFLSVSNQANAQVGKLAVQAGRWLISTAGQGIIGGIAYDEAMEIYSSGDQGKSDLFDEIDNVKSKFESKVRKENPDASSISFEWGEPKLDYESKSVKIYCKAQIDY